MNATHDPRRQSWVASAQRSTFPIQNLPFGVFALGGRTRIGIGIGDRILDLGRCSQAGLLASLPEAIGAACAGTTLNALMALGAEHGSALRALISDWLRVDHPRAAAHQQQLTPHLLAMADATMLKPAVIGNYSDFYASIDHATRVGRLFRPDEPLLPNYKYVPIGYHGRASSICVSGTTVRRPSGQIVTRPGEAPQFAPSRRLDYELEVGFFVGPGNRQGEPIDIDRAASHLFGVCLLNDWSARDIQAWEYQPLGPFLAKSFATTISGWVVSMEALEPFRVPAFERGTGDPGPLGYLDSVWNRAAGGLDVMLEVSLRTARMRAEGMEGVHLSRSNLRDLYWTPAQLVTHHTSNGCNLESGDLLGSGTVSGVGDEARGCLLEITQGGREPLTLPHGEMRRFLEDGDEVVFRGFCEREGFVGIGLGECVGVVG